MIKKKYRYFFAFKKSQENWLNNEAKKGYRLIGVGKFVYEFEKCDPGKYKYYIELVADKTYSELKSYEEHLKEQGIKYFTKNININYSLGKLRWRPFIKGPAQIVTSPGNYNKELLIIEKKADEKFKVNKDLNTLIKYYSNIRNIYLVPIVIWSLLLIFNKFEIKQLYNLEIFNIFFILAIGIILYLVIKYSEIINRYKKYK